MSRIQQKITRHTKNQKHLNLSKIRQSADAKPKRTQMLELPEKYFKGVIIKMLRRVTMRALVTNEKIVSPRRIYKVKPKGYFRTGEYGN